MALKHAAGNAIPAVLVAVGARKGRRVSLLPDTLVFQDAAGDGATAQVTFISIAHLAEVLGGGPANRLGDRGEKNRAKPLSYYVGNRSGRILLRAPYRDPAQALRGARALLDHCERQGNDCHCIVAVSAGLFSEIRARADESDGRLQLLTPAMQVLRDQCADLEIPGELREKFLGNSLHADWVRRLIILAARSEQPVLILGQTGTGKEVVARKIHDLGSRPAGPFMAVNCAAISENLFESELFGHVRGAFTGAVRDKKGFWTLAHNGTLFLDEIGDLRLDQQAKILRALEEGSYTPVGGSREGSSNARILAATNRDLPAMVRTGTFRDDLYYRLFNFRIRTPALADHAEDIPEIARSLWDRIAGPRLLPGPVVSLLMTLPWPGNVRELKAYLNHLHLLSNRKPVTKALAIAVLQECRGIVPGVGDQ